MTRQNIEIRKARSSEIKFICSMWCLLLDEIGFVEKHFSSSVDAGQRILADLPAMIRDPGCYVCVAVQGARPVGFARAQLWRLPPTHQGREEVFVNEIYVVEGFRGKGIGSSMIRRITDWGGQNGAEALRASIVASQSISTDFWTQIGARVEVQEFVLPVRIEKTSTRKKSPLGFGGTGNDEAG